MPAHWSLAAQIPELSILMRYFLAALFLMALAACSSENDARGERSVSVVAQPVKFLEEERVIEAIGTARAARSAQLFSEVSGRVTAVRFSPGAFVRQGQVLVELDARQERLALQLAEVRVSEAEQLLARYRRIEDTGAVSDSQIEAGETALAAAKIERDLAAVTLAQRRIVAPFAGHISFSEIDPCDSVTPQTLIAQLDQRSTLYVDFAAPEAVFNRLGKGQNVEVSAFSDPDSSITAKVEAVDSAIEQQQRSYQVRTVIDNRSDRFRPGMSFSVRFVDSGVMRPAVPEAERSAAGGDAAEAWKPHCSETITRGSINQPRRWQTRLQPDQISCPIRKFPISLHSRSSRSGSTGHERRIWVSISTIWR